MRVIMEPASYRLQLLSQLHQKKLLELDNLCIGTGGVSRALTLIEQEALRDVDVNQLSDDNLFRFIQECCITDKAAKEAQAASGGVETF